jgi:N-acetylmuramoyl-L-alanine amidase
LGSARAIRFVAILCCIGWITGKAVPAALAWACEPAEFPVAIDVGHNRARPGAISARGVPEFEFKLTLAREVVATLHAAGFHRSFLIGESGAPMELRERTATAERAGARVLVSIPSRQRSTPYLDPWTFQGRVREYTTYARGFSLFVSARNGFFAASKDLAARIGSELRATGKRLSVHHAEPIEGEDRLVIDAVNGVYRFDDLVVLPSAAMPAVLLEAGVIKRRDEELVVASETFQADVARLITSALEQVRCLALKPGNAPRPLFLAHQMPSRVSVAWAIQ